LPEVGCQAADIEPPKWEREKQTGERCIHRWSVKEKAALDLARFCDRQAENEFEKIKPKAEAELKGPK
jgi:hypothetical protein